MFDRGQGKSLRISLNQYEGHDYIGVRLFDNGWPTKTGCSFRMRELPDLIRVLEQIDDGGGQRSTDVRKPPTRSCSPTAATNRPPWEDDKPTFNGRGQQPKRVDPNREYPVPQSSETPFDEL